ncbi:Nucleotide-binding, alpha-beta plait [Cordyceps fumosorosea ARSEF 2679]|uniref:U4/U6 snRNA-associated-splicing factor PRP24 n=1 Tax=Cordyceps fumosorosea (strain ARSEF 2679) TaxID=1081104 RepID=A0A167LF88_CORFA|nr:Nucleotide-binding, alpha-beta plait [Cordyceps fumosorosea ARSEF 2679]OAA53019.1 Nucleotide-binding, alpha-beta plait [Cordyceps fumosorosea ARSEF 2679]
MASPVGEENWLSYLEEAARNATDLEQSVNIIELYKKATTAEPGSLRIWVAYCQYFSSLRAASASADTGWSDDENAIGREVYSLEAELELWKQGYDAIKFRVGDSHLLWDKWIAIEKDQLATSEQTEPVTRIIDEFKRRLTTPHITWDETSRAFSSFLSEYDRSTWETLMKEVTSSAQATKAIIMARDPFEMRISQSIRQADPELQQKTMHEYLEWETAQSWKDQHNAQLAADICAGLYDRALAGIFTFDETVWYGYLSFLSARPQLHPPDKLFDAARRAVQHCPSSGRLWARYLLCAEESGLSFEQIESIKTSATEQEQLCSNGMDSLIEIYQSWCGYVKRTAMKATDSDELVEIADAAIKFCIDDVKTTGNKLYAKDFQGDPKLRLERIYLQFLAEVKDAVPEARALWKKLAKIKIYADKYEFWTLYYTWEMAIFWTELHQNQGPMSIPSDRIPSLATEVLHKASLRRTIDWPEKVLELYMQHCNDYESPELLRKCLDNVYRAEKGVKKRRQREEQEQAAAYAAYYASAAPETQVGAADDAQKLNKRKHDSLTSSDGSVQASVKRQKSTQDEVDVQASGSQPGKRDRENSTIIISNLPPDTTQSKVRQYFKDYGHIKSFTAFVKEEDRNSITALVEFTSSAEAESALLRDQKYFGERQIQVGSGHDLTVYVANYPPTADERYVRELFQDCGEILSIRWPSLKVNAHRRFCYVSFRDRAAAASAVAKDGRLLDGKFKLLSKFSDPAQKKDREGAVAEGREVHVANLDSAVVESEIRDIFSKYGTVTRVNIPRGFSGKPRGFCFLDFETKEQAQKAVSELNNTKFRHQILQVSLSKMSKVKTTAKSVTTAAVDADGNSSMAASVGGTRGSAVAAEDISARTIALFGLPDTVNDARVRKLVDPFGFIIRLVMQPMHGGAIIEFADTASAGKAALQLNSVEYEGYKLRTGSPDELRRAKAERGDGQPATKAKDKQAPYGSSASEKVASSSGFMPAPSGIRRPVVARSGPKRGLGFPPRKVASSDEVAHKDPSATRPKKSNVDFKALFLASGNKKGEENGHE